MLKRSEKEAWREDLVKAFDESSAFFLVHYSGMTVEQLSELRKALRKSDASMHIVKNTIAKKAITGRDEAVVSEMFAGPVATVFAKGDVAGAAKAVADAAKTNEKLIILGGYMEATKLDSKAVQALASLPSKEVLLSKIIGSLVAPHRGLLGVMQGVPRAMVSVLNQIKEQKQAG